MPLSETTSQLSELLLEKDRSLSVEKMTIQIKKSQA